MNLKEHPSHNPRLCSPLLAFPPEPRHWWNNSRTLL